MQYLPLPIHVRKCYGHMTNRPFMEKSKKRIIPFDWKIDVFSRSSIDSGDVGSNVLDEGVQEV